MRSHSRSVSAILDSPSAGSSASAVKAFETAITVARRQGARSFGLRAALRLARLRSASDDKAQVVKLLKPGLKGFAPSPEFPEIAEAEALLAAPL